jgi:hypothetical protein
MQNAEFGSESSCPENWLPRLGGEGHRKRGMYESFLGWYLLTLSRNVMITEQVLSQLKDW